MRLAGMRFALCGPRRAEDLALILRKQGVIPLFRPALQTVLAEPPALEAQLRKFAHQGADWVIFTAGVGLQLLHQQAEALGLWEAVYARLKQSQIALRGYKAERALKELNLEATVTARDGTVDGLMAALDAHALAGSRVLLQPYGEPVPHLLRFLREKGARVEELVLYQHLPAPEEELDRLLEEILDQQVDAVVFTSAPQAEYLLSHARSRGRVKDLQQTFDRVWALAVGRVTARPLKKAGIRVWHPKTERMGALVTEFAAFLGGADREQGGMEMEKISRREVLKKGVSLGVTSVGLTGLMRGRAQSKKPRVGFIALTDAAPVIMAKELGLYEKYGLDNVEVVKEASWATVRDHLLNGEIVAAHTLLGLPLSVYTGIGGPAGRVLPIAMVLNNNGQAITLSNQDFGGKVGFKDLEGAGRAILAKKKEGKPLTFAMTFPGGTHDLWLRYWLGACGVSPVSDARLIVIPPPQMVANMSVGNMDGYCVGEPWNGVAVKEGIGFTTVASQDIWKHHPEKVLAFNNEFFKNEPEQARALTKAVLEACKWLDNLANRRKAAQIIGQRQYVNAPSDVIDARLQGVYDLGGGLGRHNYTDDYMLFHRGGQTNFPRKSYAIWFLAQYRRWAMLKEKPDYEKVAETILAQDFYASAAQELKIPLPKDDMQPLTGFIDGIPFDPKDPEGSIKRYRVREL